MRRAIDELEAEGILSGAQAELLRGVYERRLVSVYWELRALLYGGVVLLVGGLGLWLRENLTDFGHAALIGAIGAGAAGCLAYCGRRGGGFSAGELESPSPAFDYVLLLGCLLFGTDLADLELRYGLLGTSWDFHLLGSGLLCLVLAHYFDQRLVLSLALSTLGAWMGVKTSLLAGGWSASYRADALLFGGLVLGAGAGQELAGWKRHFLPVHVHLGANVLLCALVSGVLAGESPAAYLAFTLAACAALGAYAARTRGFAYLVYAFGYGYVALSAFLLLELRPALRSWLAYLVASSLGLAGSLWVLHRRLRSER